MAGNNCFLLDTQTFIWWMVNSRRLRGKIKEIISNPENAVFLSAASVWEIVIKTKIGKFKPPKSWKETIYKSRFEILPIYLEPLFILEGLPLYHKDPFDRILVAQALVENLVIITNDEKIKKYGIETIF